MNLVLVLLVISQTALCAERLEGLSLSERTFLNELSTEERQLALKVFDIVVNSMHGLRDSFKRQPKVNRTTPKQHGLASFTLGQHTHLQLDDEIVPFKKVISNNTEHLNDGVFTCETPGYYKFQVYSLTQNDKTLYLDVYLNSDRVATLWARLPKAQVGAGNAIILNLNQFDTVQVNSRRKSEMFGKPDEIYTTFTGLQLRNPRQGSLSLVAFSAAVANHQTIPGGDRVVYGTVHVDTTDSYDNYTGIYTVPSSGVYAFHFFSLANKGKEVWQELYCNTKYVCSIYGLMKDEYAGGGNTVILYLYQGDQIQVKARNVHPNIIYGTPDQMYSSLSGYQLASDRSLNNPDSDTSVYFSVGLSQGRTFHDQEIIVFDKVFSDHGIVNHYNNLTGEFTAPKTGTYEFNFHALPLKFKPVWLELYHNDRYIESLRGYNPNGYASAGNAAVIDVDAGDVVYIRAHGINGLYGLSDEIYATFSGVMLQAKL